MKKMAAAIVLAVAILDLVPGHHTVASLLLGPGIYWVLSVLERRPS